MRYVDRLSKVLVEHTSLFIILVAVVTFCYRPLFAWVQGDVQTVVLGLIMLAMGMTLTPQDFKILAQRPLDICIGACAQFTIMPLVAWCVSHIPGITPSIAVGLILVGCCPGGVSSNIMSFLCKGDVAFSVGMTTVSTLLAPVLTPLLVLALAGQSIEVNAWGLFRSILLVTILPVALGFVLNLLLSRRECYRQVKALMPSVAVICLACIVGGVVALNGDAFFASGAVIFVAVFFHNGLGYLLGYTIGKFTHMSVAKRRTLSIEVGMQNAGLATNLAMRHFAAMPEAAVASAVSCVWHSISGTLIASFFVWREKLQKNKI